MRAPKLAAVSGETNAATLNERARIAKILESSEGKRNPQMAAKLALYTPLDVETAKSLLASAPAANPYLAAMDREGPTGLDAAAAPDFANDPRAKRMAEIKDATDHLNQARGYAPRNS